MYLWIEPKIEHPVLDNKTLVEITLHKIKQSETKTKSKKKSKTKGRVQTRGSLQRFMPGKSNWVEQTITSNKKQEQVFKESVENTHFNSLIWDKIDQALYYPGLFNYFLIEGRISAEISLNHDGTLHGYPYVKRKDKKHLEQFIFAILKRAFKIPLPKNRRLKEGAVYNYNLNFKFYISYIPGEQDMTITPPIEIEGLNFYRKTFNINKSPIEKSLPSFMGGGVPINILKFVNTISGAKKKERVQKLKDLEIMYKNNFGT